MTIAEFFNMGGYAFYVWGSYGFLALAVAIEIIAVRARRRRTLTQLNEARLVESHEAKT